MGDNGTVPVVEAVITVPVPPDVAFAVSQTTAPIRYRWDPFVRRQHFVGGATRPGKGVRTYTRSRHGLTMVSEYVSFAPPTNVGMKMVRGPWFFEMFAGGWRFAPAETPGHTVATWRYSFRCRPGFLRPALERVGIWVLGRDIRRRIAGYAAGCADPVVLAAAREAIAARDE
jgi:Polyketide cyclase / dehydrase and lipid transport